MTSTLRQLTLALLTLLLSAVATFAQAAPSTNGMAVHVELGKEQFIAALYVGSPSANARDVMLKDEDKAMELRVLTDNLYARRFQRMWIEGIAINAGPAELERHAQHLADFSNQLRLKLTKGDVLRIERASSQNATKILLNGHLLHTTADARFFDLLLRTWLGPVPLSTEFKESLLAAGKLDEQLAARFNAIAPSKDRIAEVAAALKATPTSPGDTGAATSRTQNPTDQPAVTALPVPTPQPPAVTGTAPEQPPVVQPATPEPAAPQPVPQPEELATEATLFEDDGAFADEEKEGLSFTAEDLLSEQIYIAKLTKWTGNFVSYPRAALRSQKQGTVRLTVTLARDGRVKDVQILEKSEHETLNKAAAKAVKSASPYPAVPDAIKGDQFLFTVPVVFKLN